MNIPFGGLGQFGQSSSLHDRRELDEFASTARAAVIGNVVNAIVTILLIHATVPAWCVLGFAVALSLLSLWRLRLAQLMDTRVRCRQRLANAKRQVVANAAAFGVIWGFITWAIFSWGDASQNVFAGIIGAGMMSAGVTSFRTIRTAAFCYIAGWVPGCLAGLIGLSSESGYAAIALLFCYLIVLGNNIKETSRRYREAWDREKELETSRDTVKLLLNDFAEQGSDWLVEVDRKGRILSPSQRFAEAARRPIEALANKSIVSVLAAGDERSTLIDHFVNGRSFQNLLLRVVIGGEDRWWSVSGRPVRDGEIAYRGVATDITAQKIAEERVTYLAHYDALTDLPNRHLFGQVLRDRLRKRGSLAVMYLDLDNFKFVNDTLGHAMGDRLLRAASERIGECLRKKDMLARLSGDEFAILLPDADAETATRIAGMVVAAMSTPHTLGDHDVVVGASLGIAVSPTHGSDSDAILANADLALYAAKANGRNRATMFQPGMDAAAQNRRMIEMDLRNALGKNEMRLHYQPLVSAEGGQTVGYEALIRWEHPERGIVMPSQFISIAEETGLIIQLGEWVLRQAIEDLSGWAEEISVSINLSPLQMRSPSLISTLLNAIATHQVAPARICIEITETVLMQDTDANIETLHRLREIGVKIALDDFGTGYSSLNYLRSFPFSKIKIDRCFVEEIEQRQDCQAIVRSVISLANSLGMSTTAEGVEREGQLDVLRQEGCNEVQGFLYSSAVPLHELSNLRRPSDKAAVHLTHIREKIADAQKGRQQDRRSAAG